MSKVIGIWHGDPSRDGVILGEKTDAKTLLEVIEYQQMELDRMRDRHRADLQALGAESVDFTLLAPAGWRYTLFCIAVGVALGMWLAYTILRW